jgi:DNA-binding GntR family transcriptional regulator
MAAENDFHAQLHAATGNQGLWNLVRSRSGQRPPTETALLHFLQTISSIV